MKLALTLLLLLIVLPTAQADSLDKYFKRAGASTGISPSFLRAVSTHEGCLSNRNPCGESNYCNPWGYCGLMQISDPAGKWRNDPQGNVTYGANWLKGCGVKRNVISALVCYNAGSGTLDGIKSGRIRSSKVRYWIPGKGYQVGRVPNWHCPGKDCVSGYVDRIITTWQKLAHSKPTKSKFNQNDDSFMTPVPPPNADSRTQEGGTSPYLFLAGLIFYILYRYESGKKKRGR